MKYAETDETKALEWLKSLPPGSSHDLAAAGAAHHLSIESIEKARQVANTIENESVRSRILDEIRIKETAPVEGEGY